MTRTGILALLALALVPLAAREGAAQQDINRVAGRCEILDFPNNPPVTRVNIVADPTTGQRNLFAGGGVYAVCRGKDITIRADSAESYGSADVHYLIGNVRYREPKVSLDADRMTYYKREERLVAEGNVRVVSSDSSVMTGPRAEYFRAAPPIRTVSRLEATNEPVFDIVTRDSAGREPTKSQLVADHVTSVGDSLFYAGGEVRLTRPDLVARGDSATVDKGTHFARLMRDPVVEGTGERGFTLRGEEIDIFSNAQRQLERVLSKDSASVVSADVNLVADTVDLRVANDRLQRAYAWGPTRARASSPERDIFADSIDVQMPNQKIREVWAIGQAYAETRPDTTRLISEERDWIRGDTLVARFDTAATRDTTSGSRPRELVANGNASSFYQVPSSRGKAEKPGINYVRGRLITAAFRQGQIQTVTVVDRATGVYLEAAPADSTAPAAGGRRQPPRANPRRPGARP